MTPGQEKLIAEFTALNEQLNAIDGCDQSRADELAALDLKFRAIQREIEATGLKLNEVGHWVSAQSS